MFTGSGRGGRQCVYSYEDKYNFARILKSDSLIFDSHFESGNLHSAFRVLHNNMDIYDLYMHDDINPPPPPPPKLGHPHPLTLPAVIEHHNH